MDEKTWYPIDILLASKSLDMFWPYIDFEFWEKISTEYKCQQDLLFKANNTNDINGTMESALNLYGLFEGRTDLLIYWEDELASIVDLRNRLSDDLTSIEIASDPSVEMDDLTNTVLYCLLPSTVTTDTDRFILMKTGGVGGAKSIKLGNISELKILDFLETLAGILLIGGEDKYKANPIVVCAGLLLILHGIIKVATLEISEDEASVLWGLHLAKNKQNNCCDEQAILSKTNSEREKYGCEVITEKVMRKALSKLVSYKCVEHLTKPSRKTWKLKRKYNPGKTVAAVLHPKSGNPIIHNIVSEPQAVRKRELD